MAIKKVKLPNNTVVDINDARIPGVDNTPTSGSSNVVTSGGIATALGDKYEKPATGIPASDIAAGVIPSAPGTLNTTATTAQTTSSSEALSGNVTLHKVSKTGSYSDLVGKPTVDSTPTSGSSNLVSSGGVYSALSGKQATLVSGTNIKTVNNNSLLGSGNITIEAEDGVGFEDVSSQQDGTVVIALTNGDTVTIDLNHVHPQYPEYEHLEDESDMPASPDPDTLYLIDGSGGGSSNIVHLSSESQMPVSPDADTLYVINESGSGSGYESTSNKVTSLSSSSTDTQYPSAKCVYDLVGDIETLLAAL